MSGRGPVLYRGAMPAAMATGRANGLYVVYIVVVGEGVCRPFLRVGRTAAGKTLRLGLIIIIRRIDSKLRLP